MTPDDERELLRLTELLERLSDDPTLDSDGRAALEKAALALSVSFIHGLRPEIERLHRTLDKPLPSSAPKYRRPLGIDLDKEPGH